LAAQAGDAYGPSLINMLSQRDAPATRKNRMGLTPLELAIAMDHGRCALALKPQEEKLSVLEQMDRAKGHFEEAPTEFQVTELSPFMKALGDVLYSAKWPDDYRALLLRDQPQRADEKLPAKPPIEFLDNVDRGTNGKRRGFEQPFEVKDRPALAELLAATSPRLHKPNISAAARKRIAPNPAERRAMPERTTARHREHPQSPGCWRRCAPAVGCAARVPAQSAASEVTPFAAATVAARSTGCLLAPGPPRRTTACSC
jgi:hypothetical protein